MPWIAEAECDKCGKGQDVCLSSSSEAFPKCSCGGSLSRVYTSVTTIIPPHMRAEADMDIGRARHRDWLHSEDTKKKLDTGELRFATKGEYDEAGDAPDALYKHRKEQQFEQKAKAQIDEAVGEAISIYEQSGKDINKLNEQTQKLREENKSKRNPQIENQLQANTATATTARTIT